MADTKISALTSASALAGTEVFPVVQASTTKKTTIATIATYVQSIALNLLADFAIATNKFTVAAASGNTAVAGTLGVTGAATLSSTLAVTGSTNGGLYVVAAPTSPAGYSIGTRRTTDIATSVQTAGCFEIVANMAANTSGGTRAVRGRAEVQSANAYNMTAAVGLRAFEAIAVHAGAGVVSGASGFHVAAFTNTGGGTITNAIGVYVEPLTVGTNNWGLYVENNQNYFGGTASQLRLGTSSHINITGNTTTGAMLSYGSYYDGTNHIPTTTGAAQYRMSTSTHRWYLDQSGLTAGVAYTPTVAMTLDISAAGSPKIVLGTTGPTHVTASAYAFAARTSFTQTSGTIGHIAVQALVNPASNSTGGYTGIFSATDSVAGNASNIAEMTGARLLVRKFCDGVLTNAYGLRLDGAANSGAGSIVNAYALHIAAQSAATNNWGIYSVDSQNLFICTTRSPLRFGNVSSNRGYMTANTSVGAVLSYVCEHDGTNWIARNTVGGAIRINHSSFDVLLDASGLTLDTAYTPTSRFSVSTSVAVFAVPVKHPSYTLAGLPSAGSSGAGAEVYCTDHTGGARPVYSDGTNWRDYRTGSIAA